MYDPSKIDETKRMRTEYIPGMGLRDRELFMQAIRNSQPEERQDLNDLWGLLKYKMKRIMRKKPKQMRII